MLVRIAILLALQATEPVRPAALLRMEEARSRIQTAEVELIHDQLLPPGAPSPHRRSVRFSTARLAGADVIWINRGDEEGAVVRDEAGSPNEAMNSPLHYLFARGEKWFHHERRPDAELYAARGVQSPPNIRSLGIVPGRPTLDVKESVWREGGGLSPIRRYSERQEGELHVVTAHLDDGEMTWWIDPQRGWSPVKVQRQHQGKLFAEAVSEYQQIDGVWFPEEVKVYAAAHRGAAEPYETYRVLSASFNDPKHPQRFTPSDIGVTPGMMVKRFDESLEETGYGVWNGDTVLSADEFAAWKASHAAEAERGDRAATGLARPPALSEWERYTSDCIARFQLDDDQTQRAWIICREAQARARSATAKLARELATIEDSDDGRAPEPGGRLAALRDQVRERLDAIFERELQARLETLPTRAQRRAGVPASRP